MSPAQKFANLPPSKQEEILGGTDIAELEHVWDEWWARPNQVIPEDPYYPIHLLLTGRGWGKALALDTPLPTPSGWTTMGEVKEGDILYDEEGEPCTVLKVHDIFTPEEGNMFRVTTDGGNTIDACGDHQWAVMDNRYMQSLRYYHYSHYDVSLSDVKWTETPVGNLRARVVDTREMYENQKYECEGLTAEQRSNFYIGRTKALRGTYVTPPEPEYTLGAVIAAYQESELPWDMLRSLPSQRMEMLQGICDIYGEIYKRGKRAESIRFNRKFDPMTKKFVYELITSLGFEVRTEFKSNIFSDFIEWFPYAINPFRHSANKYLVRIPPERPFRSFSHTVKKVEKIDPVPVRCITVDSPHSLFLAGRAMIPTHNTRTMSEWIRRQAINYPGCRIGILGRTAADVRDVMALGEALALDTRVPTPSGFTTMGELKVGDVIYGGDGNECTVTKVYPVLENRPCYEMDISGQKVVADENHKWLTEDFLCRVATSSTTYPDRKTRKTPQVRTTGEIKNTLKKYNQNNHAIRVTEVVGSESDLPIDPYVLGYWLGDGTSKSSDITAHPDDQPHLLGELSRAGYDPLNGNICKYNVKVRSGLFSDLRVNGLLRNKHIPEEYFTSSVEQRYELLRGLLDSDGSCYKNGYAEFSNNSRELADGVYRLLSSLGVRAQMQKPDGTGNISVTFSTHKPVFKLPRKRNRVREYRRQDEFRYIRSVEPVDSVPVRCIEVDSSDHTFLITDSYIKTHNSGILNVGPEEEKPEFKPSQRKLEWPNGSVATMFSAETPDQLRGQQFHFFACDELAAYTQFVGVDGLTAFENIRIATRLGEKPYGVVATTPKRTDVIRDLLEEAKEGKVRVVRGSTKENASLSSAYKDIIFGQFAGTALAKQELEGEMLDDFPEGALWTEDMFEKSRIMTQAPPACSGGIIVSVDPSVSDSPKDECGIVVIGFTGERRLHKRQAFVLEDASLMAKPEEWAQKVVEVSNKWGASAVIVETNQGRALLNNLLLSINPNLRIIGVNASQGKKLRAEPVVLPYEQGRVHHYGKLATLESQMTTWEPEHSKKSPDRLDALVHGITAVLIDPPADLPVARVRSISPASRKMNLTKGAGQFRRSPRQMTMRRSR